MDTLFVELTAAALIFSLGAAFGRLLGVKSPFTVEIFDLLAVIAQRVVMAVEQAHGHLAGVDKKQLAMNILNEILSRLHIQAPPAMIDAAIEAAVLVLNRVGGKVS